MNEDFQTPEEQPKKTVAIDQEVLAKLVAETKNLRKEVNRLQYAADKSRLSVYDSREEKQIGKTVKVRSYDARGNGVQQLISHWSDMIVNRVEKNINKFWEEKQVIRIFFMDAKIEPLTLNYDEFVRNYKTTSMTVVKRSELEDGDIELLVRNPEGDEYTINEKFVN